LAVIGVYVGGLLLCLVAKTLRDRQGIEIALAFKRSHQNRNQIRSRFDVRDRTLLSAPVGCIPEQVNIHDDFWDLPFEVGETIIYVHR